MTTLSGITAKGEKGKSKFQSLDINSLYRGESLEPSQQKSAVPRCKHGMQSLGKVPSARRPPANLPSLKSENSGSEPAISLVPTGGAGWGNKPGESQPSTPTQPIAAASPNTTQQQQPPHQPSPAPPSQPHAAHPVHPTQHTQQAQPTAPAAPPPPSIPMPPLPAPHDQTSSLPLPLFAKTASATGDKSWSSVMAGEAGVHPPSFLAHQSPQFQQEFPKLSSGDGQAVATGQKGGSDSQYGPGPSLRPQTEGSWIQGGSRPLAGGTTTANGSSLDQGPLQHMPPGVDVAGGRSNLGPQPPPGVAMGPAGPGMPPMHLPQFRGMPVPFPMYRGNFPPGGFPPNFQPGMGPPRQRFPGNYMPDGRFVARPVENEEPVSRPIIKEEELNHMDDIARDSSWARPDEIDYNQKIVFSDNEDNTQEEDPQPRREREEKREKERDSTDTEKERDRESREREERTDPRRTEERHDKSGRNWQPGPGTARGNDYRMSYPPHQQAPASTLRPQPTRDREADDELWKERRRQQTEEVALAVERAKQRKEEEEKRYAETRRAAARKLQMLEERMKGQSEPTKEHEDSTTVIPLPDWADKNRQAASAAERPRSGSEGVEDKPEQSRHPAHPQGERFMFQRPRDKRDQRDHVEQRGRDSRGPAPDARPGSDGPGNQNFSRQFQVNLPPRFLKQQAERNQSSNSLAGNFMRSTGSPQPTSQIGQVAPGNSSFDPHWNTYSQPAANNTVNKPAARRYNSESSDSNAEKSAREREEEWAEPYDRYKGTRDNRDPQRDNREPQRDMREPPRENREPQREGREAQRDMRESSRENREPQRDTRDTRDRGYKASSGYYEDYRRYYDRRERDADFERNSEEPRDRDRDSVPRHVEERKEEVYDGDEREPQWRRSKGKSDESDRERDRPGRPDSRDSRTSRESRNSRDSAREDKHEGEHKGRGFSGAWAEDKKSKSNLRDDRDRKDHGNRHVPGPPITREKLEAAERNDPKRNLTQLKRFNDNKKTEEKEPWGTSNRDADGAEGSKTWAESMLELDRELEETKTTQHEPHEAVSGVEHKESAEAPGRPHSSGTDWNRGSRGSESDASCDDVSGSTESGKDGDKKQGKPRSHMKKLEKDERNKETKKTEAEIKPSGGGGGSFQSSGAPRYDKKDYGGREGFAPSGQPSRRGRGSMRMRINIGRRMDGYGPPPAKSPFTHNDDKTTPPPVECSEEDKTKQKQQALTASIASTGARNSSGNGSGGNKGSMPPPRMQRKSESETRDNQQGMRKTGRSGGFRRTHKQPSDVGDDAWETTSENSDGDERKSEKRDGSRRDGKGYQGRPSYGRGDSSRGPRGGGGGGAPRSNSNSDKKYNGGAKPVSTLNGRASGSQRGPVPGPGCPTTATSKLEAGLGMTWTKEDAKPGDVEKLKTSTDTETQDASHISNFQDPRAPKKNIKEVSGKPTKVEEGPKPPRSTGSGNGSGKERDRDRDRDRGIDRDRDRGRAKPMKEPLNQGVSHSTASSSMGSLTSGSSGNNVPQPLMSQVVPAPPSMKTYERPRQNKLPPRFVRQRMQKHQQLQMGEVGDAGKVNHSISMFPMKEGNVTPPSLNAWDKPIAPALRTSPPPQGTTLPMEQPPSDTSSQRSSPHIGLQGRTGQAPNHGPPSCPPEALLDGSSPPVNTIIFENTNFKSAPAAGSDLKAKFNHVKPQRMDKGERKLDEPELSELSFPPGKPAELQAAENKATVAAAVPDSMSLYKNEDMKLDFPFESELSQLTDDKTAKTMRDLTRPNMMHSHSTISPSADLNYRIAAAKKVWESTMEGVLEEGGVPSVTAFSSAAHSAVDPTAFGKAVEATGGVVADDGTVMHPNEVVYSPGPQMQVNASYGGAPTSQVVAMSKSDPCATSGNICKVKSQQQPIMTSGHSPLSHASPLSPPPYNTNQQGQFSYQQPGLGGAAAQYSSIPAIPSPPAVLYNSSSQLQPTQPGGLYQTFQIDGTQVLSGQPRSQYSQYTHYGLGQNSAFSQQSVYVHPTAPPTAAPELYQSSMSQYRLQGGPYGQSQHSNPSTVLISSNANSLMSASVKPSSQTIGAIGTKGAVPYQGSTLTSAQHSQLYIPYDVQSYLSSSMVPRAGPVQPTPSFYSSSAGAQAGFYQGPGSTLQQQGPTAPQMHQAASYNLQGFSTQSSGTPVGLQTFGSQIGAQQYRTQGSVGPPTYLKPTMSPHHPTELSLAQKGSSASSQQDVLASVFSSAPQIPSPKSRPPKQLNQQQPPPQQSPTQQSSNKYNSYQTVSQAASQLVMQSGAQQRVNTAAMNLGNVRGNSSPRYPSPIQRPVSYQHGGSRVRAPQPRVSANVKPYYGGPQDGNMKLDEGGEVKPDDTAQLNCEVPSKLAEAGAPTKGEGPEEADPSNKD